nr:hypothetical protein [uncultured Alistipes sp.]
MPASLHFFHFEIFLAVARQPAAGRIVGQVTNRDRIALAETGRGASDLLGAVVIATIDRKPVIQVEQGYFLPPRNASGNPPGTGFDFGIDPRHDAHGLPAVALETNVYPKRTNQADGQKDNRPDRGPDQKPSPPTHPIHIFKTKT